MFLKLYFINVLRKKKKKNVKIKKKKEKIIYFFLALRLGRTIKRLDVAGSVIGSDSGSETGIGLDGLPLFFGSTCPNYFRDYICKHILGVAAIAKVNPIPNEFKAVCIEPKAPRGRPAKTKKAFEYQAPVT